MPLCPFAFALAACKRGQHSVREDLSPYLDARTPRPVSSSPSIVSARCSRGRCAGNGVMFPRDSAVQKMFVPPSQHTLRQVAGAVPVCVVAHRTATSESARPARAKTTTKDADRARNSARCHCACSPLREAVPSRARGLTTASGDLDTAPGQFTASNRLRVTLLRVLRSQRHDTCCARLVLRPAHAQHTQRAIPVSARCLLHFWRLRGACKTAAQCLRLAQPKS